MKVRELLLELGKCDPEATVITEGCDCFGDVASIVSSPTHRVNLGGPRPVNFEDLATGPIVILRRGDDR